MLKQMSERGAIHIFGIAVIVALIIGVVLLLDRKKIETSVSVSNHDLAALQARVDSLELRVNLLERQTP